MVRGEIVVRYVYVNIHICRSETGSTMTVHEISSYILLKLTPMVDERDDVVDNPL